jgi:hypothetical protein
VEVVVAAGLERVVGLEPEELSSRNPIPVVRMQILVNLRLLSAYGVAPTPKPPPAVCGESFILRMSYIN